MPRKGRKRPIQVWGCDLEDAYWVGYVPRQN